MWRRCDFLESFPGFIYNQGQGELIRPGVYSDTTCLGSTLMETMLEEVEVFCDPSKKDTWEQRPHQQVLERCEL